MSDDMMYTSSIATQRSNVDVAEPALRVGAALLAFGTAYIHSTLGGLLFTLNALGFAALGIALFAPFKFILPARYEQSLRLLARLGLLGFAAATIVGWIFFGARFDLGYYATGIEVLIIAVMLVDIGRVAGGPRDVVRELLPLAPPRVREMFGK